MGLHLKATHQNISGPLIQIVKGLTCLTKIKACHVFSRPARHLLFDPILIVTKETHPEEDVLLAFTRFLQPSVNTAGLKPHETSHIYAQWWNCFQDSNCQTSLPSDQGRTFRTLPATQFRVARWTSAREYHDWNDNITITFPVTSSDDVDQAATVCVLKGIHNAAVWPAISGTHLVEAHTSSHRQVIVKSSSSL